MVSRRTVSGAEMQIKQRVERKWGSIQPLVLAAQTGRHPPQMSVMEKNRKCVFFFITTSSLLMMYCITAAEWTFTFPPPPPDFAKWMTLTGFSSFSSLPVRCESLTWYCRVSSSPLKLRQRGLKPPGRKQGLLLYAKVSLENIRQRDKQPGYSWATFTASCNLSTELQGLSGRRSLNMAACT